MRNVQPSVEHTEKGRRRLQSVPDIDSSLIPVAAFGDLDVDRCSEQARLAGYRITTVDSELPSHRPAGVDRVILSPDQLGARGQHRVAWLDDVEEIFVAWPDGRAFGIVAGGRRARIKRGLDVAVAVLALAISAPVLAVAAAWIRVDSRGPIMFRQTRVGIHGRKFELLKLRTMIADNDDSEHRRYMKRFIEGSVDATDGRFKLAADPRITRAGRWLRHFSIDELPQMWNVLRGDMSVVGPRPSSLHETSMYDATAWRRLEALPGITGVWQVAARGTVPFDTMIAMDLEYCRTWSLRLDLSLIARTPLALLHSKGGR